jgi:hypothetical protein
LSSRFQEVQRETAIILIQTGNKGFDRAIGGKMYHAKNWDIIVNDNINTLMNKYNNFDIIF